MPRSSTTSQRAAKSSSSSDGVSSKKAKAKAKANGSKKQQKNNPPEGMLRRLVNKTTKKTKKTKDTTIHMPISSEDEFSDDMSMDDVEVEEEEESPSKKSKKNKKKKSDSSDINEESPTEAVVLSDEDISTLTKKQKTDHTQFPRLSVIHGFGTDDNYDWDPSDFLIQNHNYPTVDPNGHSPHIWQMTMTSFVKSPINKLIIQSDEEEDRNRRASPWQIVAAMEIDIVSATRVGTWGIGLLQYMSCCHNKNFCWKEDPFSSNAVPDDLNIFPRIEKSIYLEDYVVFENFSQIDLLFNFALKNPNLIAIGIPPSKATTKQLKLAKTFSISRVGCTMRYNRMNLIDFMNSDYNTRYVFVQPPTPLTDVPAATTEQSSSQEKLPATTTEQSSSQEKLPATTTEQSSSQEKLPAATTTSAHAKSSQKVQVKKGKSDFTWDCSYGDTIVKPTPPYEKKYIVTDKFKTYNDDENVYAGTTYWVSLNDTTIDSFLYCYITNKNKKKMKKKNNKILEYLPELVRLCIREDIVFQNPKDVKRYLVNISEEFEQEGFVKDLCGLCAGIYNLSIMYREDILLPQRIRSNNDTNNTEYKIPTWWNSKFTGSDSKLREGIQKYCNFSYMKFDGGSVEAASVFSNMYVLELDGIQRIEDNEISSPADLDNKFDDHNSACGSINEDRSLQEKDKETEDIYDDPDLDEEDVKQLKLSNSFLKTEAEMMNYLMEVTFPHLLNNLNEFAKSTKKTFGSDDMKKWFDEIDLQYSPDYDGKLQQFYKSSHELTVDDVKSVLEFTKEILCEMVLKGSNSYRKYDPEFVDPANADMIKTDIGMNLKEMFEAAVTLLINGPLYPPLRIWSAFRYFEVLPHHCPLHSEANSAVKFREYIGLKSGNDGSLVRRQFCDYCNDGEPTFLYYHLNGSHDNYLHLMLSIVMRVCFTCTDTKSVHIEGYDIENFVRTLKDTVANRKLEHHTDYQITLKTEVLKEFDVLFITSSRLKKFKEFIERNLEVGESAFKKYQVYNEKRTKYILNKCRPLFKQINETWMFYLFRRIRPLIYQYLLNKNKSKFKYVHEENVLEKAKEMKEIFIPYVNFLYKYLLSLKFNVMLEKIYLDRKNECKIPCPCCLNNKNNIQWLKECNLYEDFCNVVPHSHCSFESTSKESLLDHLKETEDPLHKVLLIYLSIQYPITDIDYTIYLPSDICNDIMEVQHQFKTQVITIAPQLRKEKVSQANNVNKIHVPVNDNGKLKSYLFNTNSIYDSPMITNEVYMALNEDNMSFNMLHIENLINVVGQTNKRPDGTWCFGAAYRGNNHYNYLDHTGKKRTLPHLYAKCNFGNDGHEIFYIPWLIQLLKMAECSFLKYVDDLEKHDYDLFKFLKESIKQVREDVPEELRLASTIFTHGNFFKAKLDGHVDNEDDGATLVHCGEDNVIGGETCFYETTVNGSKCKLVKLHEKMPFQHGRITSGVFNKVMHSVEPWRGVRLSINVNIKRPIVKFFNEGNYFWYNIFIKDGRPHFSGYIARIGGCTQVVKFDHNATNKKKEKKKKKRKRSLMSPE